MRVFFDPIYIHRVPDGHKFPMEKYDLIPRQLLYEGVITEDQLTSPEVIDLEHVLKVHNEKYVHRLLNEELTPREQRVSGFVHSPQLIEREFRIMEGTRLAAQYAYETKSIGFNVAGGTHHAFSNRAEGFCLLNDQAIATKWLLNHTSLEKVLIIDLDVHQGNGTAEIFQNEPAVFTFSMHGRNNYPLQKEQSDLDVPLDDGCDDETYLNLLKDALQQIENQFTPDFIFYQCGVDILKTDALGKLGVSMEGCKKRDEMVFQFAKRLDVPVVCSMGGGYSKEFKYIVDAHVNTFKLGQYYFG
ncbi:MAG: histone deacetylase [Crocinitomicaceae bacterium]|nr:histone deacetylase [Crocinitomicaceae bacterium]